MFKQDSFFVAICCVFITACGGGASDPTANSSTSQSSPSYTQSSSYTILTNNSAKIVGSIFGGGTELNSNLRKQVTLSVVSTNPDFSLGNAFITRPTSSTNDFIAVIIKITNISVNLHCFIKATGVSFKNSNGQTINVNNFDYVTGSVANSTTLNVSTDTCLQAGEAGYILTSYHDAGNVTFYNDVDNIEIASIDVSTTTFTNTNPILIPTDFKIYSDTLYSLKFTSNVANQSNSKASLNQYSSYIILDNNSTPLFWSFFDGPTGVKLDANSALDMDDTTMFDGTGKSMIAFVDFTDEFSSATPLHENIAFPTAQTIEYQTLKYEYDNYRYDKYQKMKRK